MNYIDIQDDIDDVSSSSSAAECHGALCGMFCAGMPVDEQHWAKIALHVEQLEYLPINLQNLFNETQQQLDGPELAFNLLLPDDDAVLGLRVDALRDWCSGFLYGLAAAGVDPNALSDDEENLQDTAELLQDFMEITRMAEPDDESDEENAFAVEEITEYVRMGVLLINEELRPRHQQDAPRQYLH
ncbi:MAG: UPF0149 family protein [Gammaproteobacteria bacterium]|nr:UPF0149 family protein [Gammaproteobacteria bacterium]